MTEIIDLSKIKNLKNIGTGLYQDGDGKYYGTCVHCLCSYRIQKRVQGRILSWICPACPGITNHAKLK